MFRAGGIFDNLLEKATSHLLMQADWPSIIQLCDLITQKCVQPTYFLNAIRQKLFSSNEHTALNALLILESTVKNCGYLLYQEQTTSSFSETLEELATTSSHEIVRQKSTELMLAWNVTFPDSPTHAGFDDSSFDYAQLSPASITADEQNHGFPSEYLNGLPSPGSSEKGLREEEDFELAIAISQSEAEALQIPNDTFEPANTMIDFEPADTMIDFEPADTMIDFEPADTMIDFEPANTMSNTRQTRREENRNEGNDNEPNMQCVICLTNPKTYLLLDCNHLCLCNICVLQFTVCTSNPDEDTSNSKCPQCRARILTEPRKIFY